MRRRLAQLQNVRLLERCDVPWSLFSIRRSAAFQACGFECSTMRRAPRRSKADLVIDATGRGSRSPAWLRDWGCASAPEEQITVDLCYMTRHYRRKPEHLGGQRGVIAQPPAIRIGAGQPCSRKKGDRWIV